ncbi:hypothetical protein ABRT01_17780, partial [Lentibacillus sp. L22]
QKTNPNSEDTLLIYTNLLTVPRTSNQAVFFLEKDMLYTYVPYLLLPYGKSIQIVEPISLKKRLTEVLSDLIKFHQI